MATNALQVLVDGLATGSVYAIFALGYTLVFSILGIINFAHGAVFAIGAYLTYALLGGRFGFNGLLANAQLPVALPFAPALVLSAVGCGLLGIAIDWAVFRPLRQQRTDTLLTVVASLGAAVLLTNLIQYLVGAEVYTYPDQLWGGLPFTLRLGEITVRTSQFVIFAVAVVLMIALTYWVKGTRMGKGLQAVAENPTAATLLGIDGDRIIQVTFFVSSALAAVAGTLVALSVGITGPQFGVIFGLKGLAVIVLGGLGSLPGTMLAGFLLGLVEAMVPAAASGFRDAAAFAILFLVLLVRPQGLLGQSPVEKV